MNAPRSKMTLRGCTFGKLLVLHMKSFESNQISSPCIGAPTVACLPDYNVKLRSAYHANSKSA